MVEGMTVYQATTRENGTKSVSTRKGTIVEDLCSGWIVQYRVQWEDEDTPDVEPWPSSNLSFFAPGERASD